MLILGIETSCDETAASVVRDGEEILSNIILSQTKEHEKFGGIVPEIASRCHIEVIIPVIEEALEKGKVTLEEIEGVAVTIGPGLVGSLLVGISVAKAIAFAKGIPLFGVNHLEGHLYASSFEGKPKLPAIGLIVSGGHTELLFIKEYGNYKLLGRTRDDAAGEAFDKIARFMNWGYPGGPIIDELARRGNPNTIKFPKAIIKNGEYDFSFSGLKTSVINRVKENDQIREEDLAASFQEAIVSALTEKTIKAAKSFGVESIILAGGVAANSALREKLKSEASRFEIHLSYPSIPLCTDNAAMIAGVAYLMWKKGERASLFTEAIPNLKLGA